MEASTDHAAVSAITLLLFVAAWAAVIGVGVLVLVDVLHTLVTAACVLPYWAACR